MTVKMLSGAALVAMLAAHAAGAQSLAQIGGPANPPSASFKGQQFVDSRGCLFLRAGYGAGVNWVARVDRNHKPICGMPASGGAAAQAAVAADMAPDPQAGPQVQANAAPVVVPQAPAATVAATVADATPAPRKGLGLGWLMGAPSTAARPSGAAAPTIFASNATPTAQAQAPAQATPSYQGAGTATSVDGVQCYDNAPKLERVKVSGGTALVCTRGDGSTSGWRPPMVANAAQAQVAAQMAPIMTMPVVVTAPVQRPSMPVQMASVQVTMPAAAALAPQPLVRTHALPKPPKGWVYAWKDDRLNPLRGVGTAEGQAQQDLIWRRTIPMVLVSDPVPKKGLARALGLRTTVSTMSAAPAAQVAVSTMSAAPAMQVAAPQATGGTLVQVGCFGDPTNAQGVMARLAAMGLQVQTANITRNGKAMQIVYAGPFNTAPEARLGLATVHGAGFADAFLR